MRRAGRFSVILLIAMGLQSQDLPVAAQAKFLKSLLSAAGQFGFACGVSVSPGFKMAWAGSEAEARALKAEGKMVIVPRIPWLKTGGSIAIVEEDGKPAIYLNSANVKASGTQLPDVILKMAKKPK